MIMIHEDESWVSSPLFRPFAAKPSSTAKSFAESDKIMLASLPALAFSYRNSILQAALALSLTFLLYFFNISDLFLHGLFTYVHPDDVNPAPSSNGVRAAIRRPGSVDSELRPRKKPSKEKFEFDETKAQIFRLKLIGSHLQTRIYFSEFKSAFNSTVLALSCFLLDLFLGKSEDAGLFGNGSIVPILLGCFALCRMSTSLARTAFERSASKSIEKKLSFLVGVLGFVLGLIVVSGVVPKWILDFSCGSLDGFGKLITSVFMGCIAGLLCTPALRAARSFWLGTDQIRSNLSIISCGWFPRMLLYINYFLNVFTSLLWITPFSEILVDKNFVGMCRSDFERFRHWCLLASGILQILTLRSNVQMYLNEAVLCWYQRLHCSKVPELEYSRAKVFLHNHYLCLVALQYFVPAAMVLLFNGLSVIGRDGCSFLPCAWLDKELVLFMAWWIVSVWAIFSSLVLGLYRHGILFVS
ncbi:unnamed protein product [Cuscuta epithymum]|uniref:Transmembrane protein n=1 Tax=Cuscuta epithymum TaxID=186058 RepID=A0AAV0GK82_9ASTE|nr:unnamed protein product [Cuscuta epithymum]